MQFCEVQLINVLFCSDSSSLEELTFSADRIEIFYSTYQVTVQTLLHLLNLYFFSPM